MKHMKTGAKIIAAIAASAALAASGALYGCSLRSFDTDIALAPMEDSAKAVSTKEGFMITEEYSEPLTYSSGTGSVSKLGVTINYDSTFYGSDSAINRDLCNYGLGFEKNGLTGKSPEGRFFLCDMNGDRVSELLTMTDDGVLHVYEYKQAVVYDTEIMTCTLGTGAEFCGTGDFNGDKYPDLLFVTDGGIINVFTSDENQVFTKHSFLSRIDIKSYDVMCGDVTEDGLSDIILTNGKTTSVWENINFESFEDKGSTKLVYPDGFEGKYSACCTGDLNSDGYADLIFIAKDSTGVINAYTLFGHDLGVFGPTQEKGASESKGTFWQSTIILKTAVDGVAAGKITEDDICDLCVSDRTVKSGLMIFAQTGDGAYDYSIDGLLMEDGTYRIYSGARWYDESITNTNGETPDGDHVMISWSKDGENWYRRIESPAFYLGWEESEYDEWYSSNTLEPEVLYVDGVYHMYWQCTGYTESGYYGDYIGYASSTDGINWTRKKDRAVVVNVPDGLEIGFNHEEAIYVADDPDGLCWWLYTGHFINDQFKGYIRIRSSDPTTYDWNDREYTSGFGQIGNQIGYMDDVLGERMFIRITFSSADGHTVPVLQFSRDGIKWFFASDLALAAVDQTSEFTEDNRNVYFLGMATLNGTGEIPKNADGSYTITYFATTCNSSVAPEIFDAEAGYGKVTLTFS